MVKLLEKINKLKDDGKKLVQLLTGPQMITIDVDGEVIAIALASVAVLLYGIVKMQTILRKAKLLIILIV
ncbi:conserved hypothetical protein [Ricinus communis]|uniref:Uncharacterized protein n=1 Tax=Ricinus communis TaxID=3988 RepID=B9SS91_RICCO|nr:conserved hypothetical protein [Ricinus communis]